MINLINKDNLVGVLVLIYLLFSQFSFIDANHISKILPLIPLILIMGIKTLPIKMFLFMGAVPVILMLNLLFEKNSNTEGWTFVNIHLACAIFSFLLINNLGIKKYLSSDRLFLLIIAFGALIIFSTLVEFIIGLPPGRIIYGSQNLTSLTLTLSVPIAFLYIKNNKIKFLYIIGSSIAVILLIKSRGLSFILLVVVFFYLKNDIKNLPRNLKLLILIFVAVFFISVAIIFNQRFEDLFSGNSLYYRLYAWARFIETVINLNPAFGYGPSNIVVNFNEYQFLYPQIELISGLDTFYNPHSDWIFILASGGVFSLIIYLLMHIFLIFKYLTRNKKFDNNNFIQIAFISYVIILFNAQYDIINTTFSTLLYFYITQAFLFKSLINDNYLSINKNFTKIFFTLVLLATLISHRNSIDLTQSYSRFVYSQLFSTSYTDWELGSYSSHFKISDTLKTYHYLNTAGDKLNEDVLANLINNSRKYNKYLEPSFHMSTQYFSIKEDQQRLLDVYSDIFYKILIYSKVVNISLDPEKVQVILGSNLSYEKTSNQHTIILTTELFQKLMHSSTSFGQVKIDNYSSSSFTINSDDSKELLYKNVVNDFLSKLDSFKVPLVM